MLKLIYRSERWWIIYSLKQGIEEGFLALYKVIKVGLDRDLDGYRPEKDKTDKDFHGESVNIIVTKADEVPNDGDDTTYNEPGDDGVNTGGVINDLFVEKEELRKDIEEEGIFLEELIEEVGKDMDTFDLVCHIAYDMKDLTRKERVNNVKKRDYFGKYSEKADKDLVKQLYTID